jgi:hypothetical protein
MISIDEAEEIMGDNLLRPYELARALGIPHRLKLNYLTLLRHVPYRASTLMHFRHTHVLWPGFPQSLRDMQYRFPKEFYYSVWDYDRRRPCRQYRYIAEEITKKNRPGRGWYLTPKEPYVHEDHLRTVRFQLQSRSYSTPIVCEMVMLLLGYRFLRGERLLQQNTVVCFDRAAHERNRFKVGNYCEDGIGIWCESGWDSVQGYLCHRNYDVSANFTPSKPAS